ncbi:unnamed protein product [Microthlaspi erraticum]|uniref:Uncharacterized protein n=1 Tax=Microthlaspi erraticum TaxID=1685480 RepID=A0A6D2KN14_9BRAS|nr:unnamed protein product [Microthlaspi erraticum]
MSICFKLIRVWLCLRRCRRLVLAAAAIVAFSPLPPPSRSRRYRRRRLLAVTAAVAFSPLLPSSSSRRCGRRRVLPIAIVTDSSRIDSAALGGLESRSISIYGVRKQPVVQRSAGRDKTWLKSWLLYLYQVDFEKYNWRAFGCEKGSLPSCFMLICQDFINQIMQETGATIRVNTSETDEEAFIAIVF